MLPDVHLQFVKAIADRFCPENGWQTVYVVTNTFQAEEVNGKTGKAEVIHGHRNKKGIQRMLHQLSEQGINPLTIAHNSVGENKYGEVLVPLPVQSIHPKCERCNASLCIYWHKRDKLHFTRCKQCKRQSRASINSHSKGINRQFENKFINKRWTKDESTLVCTLKSQGYTYSQVAEKVGRTFNSVSNHILTGGYEGMLKRQQQRQYLKQFDDI